METKRGRKKRGRGKKRRGEREKEKREREEDKREKEHATKRRDGGREDIEDNLEERERQEEEQKRAEDAIRSRRMGHVVARSSVVKGSLSQNHLPICGCHRVGPVPGQSASPCQDSESTGK